MAFVVFAGQSNMGGPGADATDLWPAWRADPLTRIWDAGVRAWVELRPGVNSGYADLPGVWGPEVAFAVAFRARFPDEPLHIVKAVHGGTGLSPDPDPWKDDWSQLSSGELLDDVAEIVRAASGALGGAKPSVVFFGQGEEDANSAAAAGAYQQNLAAVFARMRADWMGDPAGRIVFFRIGDTPPFAAEVRAAQAAVDAVDPAAASFDTLTLPRQADGLHLSALGLDLAGDAFFRLYAGSAAAAPGEARLGSPGADTFLGGAGRDSFAGLWGQDFVRGGEGDDVLVGGDSFDDLHGNQGADTLSGEADGDWVVGGKGDDRLSGDAGDDVVLGNIGHDLCDGGEGNDTVRGGQDGDRVMGRAGDDWLSGDRGADTLSGGPGADIFHVFADAGLDRVTDFSATEGDRIQLEPGASYSVAQSGADTVVTLAGGAQMVLVGVAMSSLTGQWIFGA